MILTMDEVVNDIITLFDSVVAKAKQRSCILRIIDELPIVFWYKDVESKMQYCTRIYESIYLTPRGFTRNDYYGHDDYSVWPKDMAKLFIENDAKQLKDYKPRLYTEPVLYGNKLGHEVFCKYVKIIDGKTVIAGAQVSYNNFIKEFIKHIDNK